MVLPHHRSRISGQFLHFGSHASLKWHIYQQQPMRGSTRFADWQQQLGTWYSKYNNLLCSVENEDWVWRHHQIVMIMFTNMTVNIQANLRKWCCPQFGIWLPTVHWSTIILHIVEASYALKSYFSFHGLDLRLLIHTVCIVFLDKTYSSQID